MIGVPQVFPGYTMCIVSDAGGVESGLAPLFLFLLQAVVEMSTRPPRMNVAGRMAKTPDFRALRRGRLVGRGAYAPFIGVSFFV